MNKRIEHLDKQIKRLAKQCGLPVAGSPMTTVGPKDIRRFAELLIKDVAHFVGQQRNDIPACGFEFETAVKEHYGVE